MLMNDTILFLKTNGDLMGLGDNKNGLLKSIEQYVEKPTHLYSNITQFVSGETFIYALENNNTICYREVIDHPRINNYIVDAKTKTKYNIVRIFSLRNECWIQTNYGTFYYVKYNHYDGTLILQKIFNYPKTIKKLLTTFSEIYILDEDGTVDYYSNPPFNTLYAFNKLHMSLDTVKETKNFVKNVFSASGYILVQTNDNKIYLLDVHTHVQYHELFFVLDTKDVKQFARDENNIIMMSNNGQLTHFNITHGVYTVTIDMIQKNNNIHADWIIYIRDDLMTAIVDKNNLKIINIDNGKIVQSIELTDSSLPIAQINNVHMSLTRKSIEPHIIALLMCMRRNEFNIPKFIRIKIVNDLCELSLNEHFVERESLFKYFWNGLKNTFNSLFLVI